MGKLIIHSEIGDDAVALYLVSRVVHGGKVSPSDDADEQYQPLSVFQANDIKIQVCCVTNKFGTSIFFVKEESND